MFLPKLTLLLTEKNKMDFLNKEVLSNIRSQLIQNDSFYVLFNNELPLFYNRLRRKAAYLALAEEVSNGKIQCSGKKKQNSNYL